MKNLKTLFVTALAIGFGMLAAQHSIARMSDKEARSECQEHLDHARQLLDDGQWKTLALEAQAVLDTSKSIERMSGETEKEHNKMHDAIKQHATKLIAAARDENRTEATEHFNELAACLQPKAGREGMSMHKAMDNAALTDLREHAVRAGELLADKKWAALVEETGKIKSAAKLIVGGKDESEKNHELLHNSIRITADKLADAANAKNAKQAKKECKHLQSIVEKIETVQS